MFINLLNISLYIMLCSLSWERHVRFQVTKSCAVVPTYVPDIKTDQFVNWIYGSILYTEVYKKYLALVLCVDFSLIMSYPITSSLQLNAALSSRVIPIAYSLSSELPSSSSQAIFHLLHHRDISYGLILLKPSINLSSTIYIQWEFCFSKAVEVLL